MILTNGSVMFKRVKLSVLSNAPLCALPKILQANKPPRGTESSMWHSIARSLFFILHIYNPSCAVLLLLFFFFKHVYTACTTFIYSYIHTSCDVLWSTEITETGFALCFSGWLIISCVRGRKPHLPLFRHGRKTILTRLQVNRLPTSQHIHEELQLQRN